MAMTFGKAGRLAALNAAQKQANTWFFIDDNVGLKVITNEPTNKKIIGFEFKWRQEDPVKFMVKGSAHPKGFSTILKAFQAGEKYLEGKK
jgi:hypothetical protein